MIKQLIATAIGVNPQQVKRTLERLNKGATIPLIEAIQSPYEKHTQLANRCIKHPWEVVSIHQQVRVKVEGIDREQKRFSLSMKLHIS